MIALGARVAPRRRSWVAPTLWLGIPTLLTVGPWSVRQWAAAQAHHLPSREAALQLTGEGLRDRRAILERAWMAARPQPLRRGLPPAIVERIARRQAGWLVEIAGLLLPLDRSKAEQAAGQAIERLRRLPERMGPEDLAAPLETPTGQLLRLAQRFQSVPAVAEPARRAALERARAAAWPGGRAYALCLCARELTPSSPALARKALQEARAGTERLPGDQRLGALAALAGVTAVAASPESARPLVARTLEEAANTPPEPVPLALVASMIAPAAPEAADRLAQRAVDRAAAATVLPDDLPLRGSFRAPLLAALRDPDRPFVWPSLVRARHPAADEADGNAADLQLRRVAAVLAIARPAVARRAALLIQFPGDRAGSLTEVAASIEEHDPARAEALYRLALKAADELLRPAAARRAARVRAAAGLAAYDPPAALAVVEPMPPRLIAFELNDLAARLARRDPTAARRLIERGEQSVEAGDGQYHPLFGTARAAVAARLARRDPGRAASLVASLPMRRSVDAWITLARALAASGSE